ncbi:hypothetical protein [Candidatus Methanomethylophilus sp. 1R26]|nr:hypothetical protein [Candidatus Methanomethylophilus sp. 1R26]
MICSGCQEALVIRTWYCPCEEGPCVTLASEDRGPWAGPRDHDGDDDDD